MDKLNIDFLGGLKHKIDHLLWMLGTLDSNGEGIYTALDAILGGFGSNFIITGCTVTSDIVAEGWIYLDNELIKVDSHTQGTAGSRFFEKVTTTDSRGDVIYADGNPRSIYQKIRATATASSGNLDISGDRLEDTIVRVTANQIISGNKSFTGNIGLGYDVGGTFPSGRVVSLHGNIKSTDATSASIVSLSPPVFHQRVIGGTAVDRFVILGAPNGAHLYVEALTTDLVFNLATGGNRIRTGHRTSGTFTLPVGGVVLLVRNSDGDWCIVGDRADTSGS